MRSRHQPGEVQLGAAIGHAAYLCLSGDLRHNVYLRRIGITEKGEVKDTSENVMCGLFAAGEITGGSFFNNYPGGSGLMKGAVFGRLAGTSAADFAKAKRA